MDGHGREMYRKFDGASGDAYVTVLTHDRVQLAGPAMIHATPSSGLLACALPHHDTHFARSACDLFYPSSFILWPLRTLVSNCRSSAGA